MDNDYDHILDDEYADNDSVAPETQPQQVFVQPVYTQPVIAQPIYTHPVIMQRAIPSGMTHPYQGYLPVDEIKSDRWHAPPFLVFAALLLCPPIGLILLLFFTKWGVFPKLFLTLFTLACIWFVYEVIAFYTDFDLPSLLNKLL